MGVTGVLLGTSYMSYLVRSSIIKGTVISCGILEMSLVSKSPFDISHKYAPTSVLNEISVVSPGAICWQIGG